MEVEQVTIPCLDLQHASAFHYPPTPLSAPLPAVAVTPRSESAGSFSDSAALKVQKVYRSYRTRRRLADSAVVAEELWWRAIDYARLNLSTISFFNYPESPHTRWSRITHNASKVGKGLTKDEKAKELAFQHWIEAIDPRHRYGSNLHCYYEEWSKGDAGQPFFHWLDLGRGKDVDLTKCPRSLLRQQCVRYLGPQEREHYEYVLIEGKMVHKQTGDTLDTTDGCQKEKWIFVMGTSKKLYAGQKKKGVFHHSSFLAGGATLAAGRLVAESGSLKAIWAYSGHYRPTEENQKTFLSFLEDNGVNLAEVKILSSSKEDYCEDGKAAEGENSPQQEPCVRGTPVEMAEEGLSEHNDDILNIEVKGVYKRTLSGGLQSPRTNVSRKAVLERINSKSTTHSYELGHQLSRKWSTGAGPRIGCVADYPPEVRLQALEFVKLSPRLPQTPSSRQFGNVPAPSTCWSPRDEHKM